MSFAGIAVKRLIADDATNYLFYVMKGLTLWQPWAALIGRGKHHETRSWATHYRGAIAIHAALRKPHLTDLSEATRKTVDTILGDIWMMQVPRGAIVAVAHLKVCVPTEQIETDAVDLLLGNYNKGRWAWELCNIHILSEPVPFKGAQGLWNVPVEIEKHIDTLYP